MYKKMRFDLFYQLTKYSAILKLLRRSSEAHISLNGRKIFFTNINSIGILEKAARELTLARETVYKDSDVFIDVGAHIGTRSLLMHDINSKCRIIAFEPNPITFDSLNKNLAHIKNGLLFQIALGDEKGVIDIFYDIQHLDTASLNRKSFYLQRNAKQKLKSMKAQTRQLDEYVKYIHKNENVYLKIDVETFEKEVLRGGKQMLAKIKYLEIEIAQNKEQKFSDVISFIKRKYDIIDIDMYRTERYIPQLVNILIELC